MKKFRFKARDKGGKLATGVVEASSEQQAASIVRGRGLVVVRLSVVEANSLLDPLTKAFHRIGISEVAVFTRQLSTMVTAGLQLTNALMILQAQSSSAMGEIVSAVQSDVSSGSALSEAMSRHPKAFSKVYIALIRAGEAAGVLDDVLERLSDNLEKQKEFESKVKGAMVYPAIVIAGMGLVSAIMMIFVVPKLTSLYTEFGAKLPAPTRILISSSKFMGTYWWVLAGLLVGGFLFFSQYGRTKRGKRFIDNLKLRIPVVGRLNKVVIMTEFSRTLGLLVGAGISIIDALDIVAGASGNSIYEESLRLSAKQVEKGLPLAYTIANDPNYPPIVPQMISVGEETGKLDEVLGKMAHYFESESEMLVKGLTTAIEPIIMILLGLGVGFLVIAIIMPIYSLTSQF